MHRSLTSVCRRIAYSVAIFMLTFHFSIKSPLHKLPLITGVRNPNEETEVSNSESFEKFGKTIHRAWKIAGLRYGLIEHRVSIGGLEPEDYDDLGRASIVLSVAAIDGYFTDAFLERLISFMESKEPTDKLVEILGKAGIGTKEVLELLNKDNPHQRIKISIESYLEKFVTQKTEKVDDLFLAYNYKNICNSAANKCGDENVLSALEEFVGRRHQIVHDGDYLKDGQLRGFSQDLMTDQVQSIERFILAFDEILFKR